MIDNERRRAFWVGTILRERDSLTLELAPEIPIASKIKSSGCDEKFEAFDLFGLIYKCSVKLFSRRGEKSRKKQLSRVSITGINALCA